MNSKTTMLAFSIAVILSTSIVTLVDIPHASADKSNSGNEKKIHFNNKPDFKAKCDQINTGIGTDWQCKALFWLDKDMVRI